MRARIRASTRMSEERLFGNSLAAARAQSFCKRPFHQGPCDDKLCGIECGDCDSDEDEANDDPAESDPRMARGDDDEEAELLRRLRATRLAALKAAAEKAARPAMKYEYIEERALLLLLDDPAAPPTVCLVGCEEDAELSVWIDDHLTVRCHMRASASLAARRDGLTRLPQSAGRRAASSLRSIRARARLRDTSGRAAPDTAHARAAAAPLRHRARL